MWFGLPVWARYGIILCLAVIIYAIYKLIRIHSLLKSVNQQSESEIEAVKNMKWSQLRSEENMDALQLRLMKHITPRLKCPGSAVICPAEEMIITGPNDNGKFKISGYVDSQNSFGALKRTKFNATAHYSPNRGWVVEKVSLLET